jgi:hypothetical protein
MFCLLKYVVVVLRLEHIAKFTPAEEFSNLEPIADSLVLTC